MFIAFEGLDGSGKSTQAKRLAERLRTAGREVALVNDPGTTPLGSSLRETLLHGCLEMGARAEALLFCAARAQLVEQAIRPALAEGKIVVADRYAMSTVAYQGYGAGLPLVSVRTMNSLATGGLMPHKTFVFDLPVGVAMSRLKGAADRIERRGEAFFERLRKGYQAEAAWMQEGGQSVEVIDATCSAGAIETFVWEQIESLLTAQPVTA